MSLNCSAVFFSDDLMWKLLISRVWQKQECLRSFHISPHRHLHLHHRSPVKHITISLGSSDHTWTHHQLLNFTWLAAGPERLTEWRTCTNRMRHSQLPSAAPHHLHSLIFYIHFEFYTSVLCSFSTHSVDFRRFPVPWKINPRGTFQL